MTRQEHGDETVQRESGGPEWKGPRVTDPDEGAVWLAIDTFPTEEAALAEARNGDAEAFARVIGKDRFRLRWLDEADEADAYLIDEWGATTTVEPDEQGREFWLVVTDASSAYIPEEAA